MPEVKAMPKAFHPEIFRAYDIRGLYPQELDENAAALIAAGFAEYSRRRGSGRRVLIGRDVRWSSQELGEALKERLCALGAEVIDIGLATTPMFTFAMHEARADFGFMVTASHNTISYNGFKLYEKTRTLSEKSGLGEIRELAARGEFGILSESRGSFEKKDFLESYVKFLLSQVRLSRKISAVFDAGGGATAMVLPELLKKEKNIQAAVLFKDLDPALARRHPDPLAPGASEFAREAVLRQEAEVGFVFDIDGDRVVVLNERGEAVRGDAVLWLLSQELSQGEGVVFDIRSSRALREDLEERRLRALPSRVGHSFIKETMRESGAKLGGELSGHFYFEEFFHSDSAILAALKILEILSRENLPLSELTRPYLRYFHSGEKNLKTAHKAEVLKGLEERYADGRKNYLDGLTVEYPHFWFNVRPSNTENLLRFVMEARDKKTFEEKKDELAELLMKLGALPA
ncbi:MAG: phosphomannomutase/phosphoglucomutase [bacterium]|nr:phosphomannomutase/phosphoglucomutase [bacterium]